MADFYSVIKTQGLSRADVARKLGIAPNFLSEIANFKKPCSLERAYLIAVMTGGLIPMTYWLENRPSGLPKFADSDEKSKETESS